MNSSVVKFDKNSISCDSCGKDNLSSWVKGWVSVDNDKSEEYDEKLCDECSDLYYQYRLMQDSVTSYKGKPTQNKHQNFVLQWILIWFILTALTILSII